jgi:murein DD-endopeptidase MepM/ murein hydrolase activator NlpD
LEGEPLEALSSPDLLKNPFVAPRPGYDDGHPGIDLAYWTRPDGQPMLGLPIHSIFAGTVAFIIQNRQPYGNAVVIESSLAQAPKIQATAAPLKTLQPSFSLACPDYFNFKFNSQDTAIYVLYAHLNETPIVRMGDTVACSQPIGQVGTTGRSVNPHLHLEIRTGPAGVRFVSMAHYDSSASQDELRSYCLWRVSGAFPPLDPLSIFFQPSQSP